MITVDIMQSQNTSLRHPFVLDSAIEVTPGARDNAVVPREKNWLKRADGSRSRVPSNGKSYINAGFYVFEWHFIVLFLWEMDGHPWKSMDIHIMGSMGHSWGKIATIVWINWYRVHHKIVVLKKTIDVYSCCFLMWHMLYIILLYHCIICQMDEHIAPNSPSFLFQAVGVCEFVIRGSPFHLDPPHIPMYNWKYKHHKPH